MLSIQILTQSLCVAVALAAQSREQCDIKDGRVLLVSEEVKSRHLFEFSLPYLMQI